MSLERLRAFLKAHTRQLYPVDWVLLAVTAILMAIGTTSLFLRILHLL